MKTYFQQLKPIVTPYLKNYETDFTNHDKKQLTGYSGEFYYGMRTTGTDIFCIDKFEIELKKLQSGEKTDFFTSGGLLSLFNHKIKPKDMTLELFSLLSDALGNERFFIGKNGKIIELPKDKFRELLNKRLETLQKIMDEIKGSVFVWNLYRELEINETKKRELQLN
jgi:hypothetical protein